MFKSKFEFKKGSREPKGEYREAASYLSCLNQMAKEPNSDECTVYIEI
jgi:hypothetical protein